ncbi:MAG: adenylosuccinate synthase, partial [Planctomycetota bacterium]
MGWGDEGKGKIVDLICPRFDLVVRYNGGANAGHTVCVGGETFALHLLPSGVLHEALGVIGTGVVVDPVTLLEEIDGLRKRGIDVTDRLRISERAHLVLPYHKLEDRLTEEAAGREQRLGTTVRGIGPCYADKARRHSAVRMVDLLSGEACFERVRAVAVERKQWFTVRFGQDGGLDPDAVVSELRTAADRLRPMICDTTVLLHDAMDEGRSILFEGANGLLLDVDHGTYPFVTSSSTGPHGIGAGAGVPAERITTRIGTCKAYATRVGSGPFVSELRDVTGDRIREQGKEFGTTTGRPRRCGWFDAVAARYAARLSGTTDLAVMHLDTLQGIDPIGICTAYRIEGRTVTSPPADAGALERAEAVVEHVPGWQEDLRGVRRFEDLPAAPRRFIERIEALVGVPVSLIGVGPERSQ